MSPLPHAWATSELKEKATQILVIGRNYCQPIWRSRALLLGRSNIFKCKWTQLPTSITFKFNFASCLGCQTRDDLSVHREIKAVPYWVPFCSMRLFPFSLSVPLCHALHTKFISHAFLSTYDLRNWTCTLLFYMINQHSRIHLKRKIDSIST